MRMSIGRCSMSESLNKKTNGANWNRRRENMEVNGSVTPEKIMDSIVELEMKDFIELMTIADMGWQPNRPQTAAEKWLPRLKEIAKQYGINWTGRR